MSDNNLTKMNSFLSITKYLLFMLLILILVILVMIVLSLFLFNSITSSSYNDYTELVESQVIDKGWVPEFIPKSARNIFEEHNIDTNSGFVEFTFSLSDKGSLLTNFYKLNKHKPIPCLLPPHYMQDNTQLELYISDKASHKNYSLSINWDTKQACYNY